MLLNKEILIGIYEGSSVSFFEFWQFANNPGASISNVNLSFSPSTTVQLNWGDGSAPENIDSGTNYNHAFVA
jgi:hypothetical protein